jgi:replicative DNA helicase
MKTRAFENLEYEQNILGQLLLDNSLLETVAIDIGDFTTDLNRRVFVSICDRIRRHEPANIQTISISMPADTAYVAALTNIPSTANIAFYQKELKNLRLARALRDLGLAINEKVGLEDPEDVKTMIEESLTRMGILTDKKLSFKISDYHAEVITDIEKAYNQHGKITGISSGFPSIDETTDGFHGGEYTIIGARPSQGKTALALQMARSIAMQKIPVGFFSLEMSGRQIDKRLISIESGITQTVMRRGPFTNAIFSSIMMACDKTMFPLFIYDQSLPTIGDIQSEARRLRRKENIQAIFIDYMSLINCSNKTVPRWEQVSEISKSMKGLARELDIPIIVLAQLGRQTEGKEPCLADLRESGSIEQDADVVMFIHRDREDRDGKSELIIAKQRNGPLGRLELTFIGNRTMFVEAL